MLLLYKNKQLLLSPLLVASEETTVIILSADLSHRLPLIHHHLRERPHNHWGLHPFANNCCSTEAFVPLPTIVAPGAFEMSWTPNCSLRFLAQFYCSNRRMMGNSNKRLLKKLTENQIAPTPSNNNSLHLVWVLLDMIWFPSPTLSSRCDFTNSIYDYN